MIKHINPKQLPLLMSFLFPFYWACSQSKPLIRESYGFYAARLPGNIPVGDGGNPLPGFGVDTIYTIYIISTSKDLKWDTAWAGKKVYSIMAYALNEQTVEAGTGKEPNLPLVIRARKGGVIWRLDLLPLDPMPEIRGDYRKGVLLKGHKIQKSFELKIDKLVELRVPASV